MLLRELFKRPLVADGLLGDILLPELEPVKEGKSYFADCPRDDKGHCDSSGGPAKDEPKQERGKAQKPEEKPKGKADKPEAELAPPPKKEKPPETKLGKSAAKVTTSAKVNKAALAKASASLFGEKGIAEVASVVGMPDDAKITVTSAGEYEKADSDDIDIPEAMGIRVEASHPKMGRVSRFIGVDGEGKKFIKNEILEIKPQFQGEGLGATIFAKQVENAAENGFDYISAHAAGGPGRTMNGYYTWPRFGYDESVKSIAKHNNPLAAKILDAYPDARSVRDVMATSEGRSWWKDNGGDLYNAKFDVKDGSWSRHILDTYLAEKKGDEQLAEKLPKST